MYQYVVNAAGSSGQYMGLMTMGPDGKLSSMRTDRDIIPQQPSSTAVSTVVEKYITNYITKQCGHEVEFLLLECCMLYVMFI